MDAAVVGRRRGRCEHAGSARQIESAATLDALCFDVSILLQTTAVLMNDEPSVVSAEDASSSIMLPLVLVYSCCREPNEQHKFGLEAMTRFAAGSTNKTR